MDSLSLEKQVNDLLTTKFEQPEFEQSIPAGIKSIFKKEMLVSAAGTALSVQIGNIVSNVLPLPMALPVGSSSILAGVLMQKFGGKGLLNDLSLGIIQGGMASALTPFVNKIIPAQFSQEVKQVVQEAEINPLTKGVMW